MGDDERAHPAAGPAPLEVLGEPRHALDVEVVGGLVEEDHVVVADQHVCQRDPSLLAAGEVADHGVGREVGDQPGHDVANARVRRPLVFVCVAGYRVDHRVRSVHRVVLVEDADARAASDRDAALVRLEVASEDLEKGRLASAVGANDADAIAVVEADRYGIEDGAGAEVEVKRLGA